MIIILIKTLSKIREVLKCYEQARKLLLDDAIDSGDYKTIKQECEAKLTGFSKQTFDLEGCVNKAIDLFSRLDVIYTESDTARKRSIIGSIYLEKLCFDGTTYRAGKINEAARLMFMINSKLGAKKIGQNLIYQACPIR